MPCGAGAVLASRAVMGDSGMDDSLSLTARPDGTPGYAADGFAPRPAHSLAAASGSRAWAATPRRVPGSARPRLVAVLEVLAADAVDQRGCGQQHRRGRALLLASSSRAPRCRSRLAHPVQLVVADVALQAGADRAGHQRVDRDPVIGPAPGRLDREQDVGRLGLRVGEPRVVRPLRGSGCRRRRSQSRGARSNSPRRRGPGRARVRAPAASAPCSPVASAKWPRWLVANCISQPCGVRISGEAIRPALLTRTLQRSVPGRHECGRPSPDRPGPAVHARTCLLPVAVG